MIIQTEPAGPETETSTKGLSGTVAPSTGEVIRIGLSATGDSGVAVVLAEAVEFCLHAAKTRSTTIATPKYACDVLAGMDHSFA
jgi:hypothetical protein